MDRISQRGFGEGARFLGQSVRRYERAALQLFRGATGHMGEAQAAAHGLRKPEGTGPPGIPWEEFKPQLRRPGKRIPARGEWEWTGRGISPSASPRHSKDRTAPNTMRRLRRPSERLNGRGEGRALSAQGARGSTLICTRTKKEKYTREDGGHQRGGFAAIVQAGPK